MNTLIYHHPDSERRMARACAFNQQIVDGIECHTCYVYCKCLYDIETNYLFFNFAIEYLRILCQKACAGEQ